MGDQMRVKTEVIEVEYPLDQLESDESSSATDESLSFAPVYQLVQMEQPRVKQEPVSEESSMPVIFDVRSMKESFSSRHGPDTPQVKMSVKEEPMGEEVSRPQLSSRKRRTSSQQPDHSSHFHCQSMKCVKSEPRDGEEPSMSTVTSSSMINNELGAIQQLLSTLQRPVDQDQVFGDHVACELRGIHDTGVKRRCKRLIMEALLSAMTDESYE